MSASVFAQAPEKMSYQAVIRNNSNALVTSSAVGMRMSILQTTPSGTAVYVETQTPTTNANGLASIEIGGGTVLSGSFANIDWANGPYFVKTETDPTGGSSYSITGTSQLLSVPYALHAKTAETVTGGITETDPIFGASVASGITGTDTTYWNNKLDSYTETDPIFSSSIASGITSTDTSNWNNDLIYDGDTTYWKVNGTKIYYNNGFVGIGTSNPGAKLHINNDVFGSDSSVYISSKGNIVLGTSSQLNTPNALTIYRSMGSNTLSPGQHNAQIRILNTNGNKALVIGSLDDGTGFIQANEVNVGYQPLLLNPVSGNVGIGTSNPARTLHVNSVMRLQPIPTAPSSPAKGDMYFDSTLNKLRVYDGTTWQNCW